MKKKRDWTSGDIKKLRTILKLTQAELGELLGVTGNYIWMLEADQKPPSKTLKLLLNYIERDRKKNNT